MSNTIMANAITTGVRRLTTTAGLSGFALGSVQDVAQGMLNEGYNQIQINNLVAGGATEAQLQYLWDNYAAGSVDFGRAATTLQQSLIPSSILQNPVISSGIDAAGALYNTVVQTAFGSFDFAAQATWDYIAGLFTQTQRDLNLLASRAPKDPEVIQMVTQFNSLVGSFANKYSDIVGSAPSPIPFASVPATLGVLPALPIAYVAAGAVIVAGILGTLYLLKQRIIAKTQQIQAQNQAAILSNPNLTPAQQNAMFTAAAPSVNLSATDWGAWLQQNTGFIFGGLLAAVIGMKLLKKL